MEALVAYQQYLFAYASLAAHIIPENISQSGFRYLSGQQRLQPYWFGYGSAAPRVASENRDKPQFRYPGNQQESQPDEKTHPGYL